MDVSVMPDLLVMDRDLQSELTSAWQTLSTFDLAVPYRNDLFTYFRSLKDILTALKQAGQIAAVEAAMNHIGSLAERVGCSPTIILGGEHFFVEPEVIVDTLANLNNSLLAVTRTPAEHRNEQILDRGAATVGTDPELENALALAWQTLSEFSAPISQSTDLFAYFKNLGVALIELRESGGIASVRAAMSHVDYLAQKAGCKSVSILGGGAFTAKPRVIRDTLANVSYALRMVSDKAKEDQTGNTLQSTEGTTSAHFDVGQRLPDTLALAWQILSRFHIAVPQSTDLFAYFKTLNEILMPLDGLGSVDAVETAMEHIDYLAKRAGCTPATILSGAHFTVAPQVIQDTLINLGTVLEDLLRHPLDQAPDDVPKDVFALILKAEVELTGWCSRDKALVIARTVLRERPGICVEIGVFGGRSLVPCAAALRHIGAGVIYGIEAWSPDVAVENATDEGNDEWWSKLDFAAVKREFYRFVAATKLTQQVRVIEAPSGRASALFDEIDFLHIDGSHSMVNAAEDVILYARKVRRGGIIVFDDIDWETTAPARELLTALCDPVLMLKDPESGRNICAVLRRR